MEAHIERITMVEKELSDRILDILTQLKNNSELTEEQRTALTQEMMEKNKMIASLSIMKQETLQSNLDCPKHQCKKSECSKNLNCC